MSSSSALLLFLYCLLFGRILPAQPDDIQQIARGISKYRSFLLESKPNQRRQLGAVIQKLNRLRISEEERSELTTFIGNLSQPEGTIDPDHFDYSVLKLQSKTYLDSLTDQEIQIIADNADLYDLINIGVLELDYPYKVSSDFQLHKELFFYNIHNGERIGEVGAGNGEFSMILAMIYDSLEIFINELDRYQLSYIQNKVDRLMSVTHAHSMTTVLGETWKTNLEETPVDKLILRNSYHHFTDKKHMLSSINSSLTEKGELFVYEATRDLNRKEMCDNAIAQKDILKAITKAGFELLDQIEIDRVMIFKFRKHK